MTISVLVPTYRRPDDLARCLGALVVQTRRPDEVLVVVRDTDTQTLEHWDRLRHLPLPIRRVVTTTPGQVAALNRGLGAARGDLVAITDDDAAPLPGWLQQVEARFHADPLLGGVGGIDRINGSPGHPSPITVGRVQWFGRYIGNHHRGGDAPQEVDILKGANMVYRRRAIGTLTFDERLRGSGAQVHNDMAFSLRLRRAGWRLLYDPAIAVDHYPGTLTGEDHRVRWSAPMVTDAVHNETLALLGFLPPLRRFVFLCWAIVVGTRDSPGLVQCLCSAPRVGASAGTRLLASVRGRHEGWRTWRQGERDAQAGTLAGRPASPSASAQ